MSSDIRAIFLDVGNTLRIVVEDERFQAQARQDFMNLVEQSIRRAAFSKSWMAGGKRTVNGPSRI
jgi:hypothetical protein